MKKIAVIGLGYVGLPLAVAFGEKRAVVGFDINQKRIDELNAGKDVTREAAVFNPVVQMTAFKQPVYCAQFPAAFQD